MGDLHTDDIRAALSAAKRLGMRRVSVSSGDEGFRATLDWSAAPEDAADFSEVEPAPAAPALKPISAPVVGYFRPKIAWEAGTAVTADQTVAEVLALGIANDVKSKHAGVIVETLVADGDPVEFGQALAHVEAK